MSEQSQLLEVTFAPEWVSVIVRPEAPISHLSHGIECGIAWFLGRGVSRFQVTRERHPLLRQDVIDVTLAAKDADTTRPLSCAAVTSLSALAEHGYLPKAPRFGQSSLKDCARSVTGEKNPLGNEGTIMQYRGIRLEHTIASLAFGVGDTLVSFFLAGAERAIYEVSQTDSVLWVDKGFEPDALKAFWDKNPDYVPEDRCGRFPWRV